MNHIEHESIYEFITRIAESHASLSYNFQDLGSARKSDVKHVFLGEELPLHLKQNMDKALMDKVIACIRTLETPSVLRSMLENVPLHMYVLQMADRMKLWSTGNPDAWITQYIYELCVAHE